MPTERINRTENRTGVVAVMWGKQQGDTFGNVRVGIERHLPPTGDGPGPIEAEDSQPLSRTDLNALIRTLRRARDQAFGTDA